MLPLLEFIFIHKKIFAVVVTLRTSFSVVSILFFFFFYTFSIAYRSSVSVCVVIALFVLLLLLLCSNRQLKHSVSLSLLSLWHCWCLLLQLLLQLLFLFAHFVLKSITILFSSFLLLLGCNWLLLHYLHYFPHSSSSSFLLSRFSALVAYYPHFFFFSFPVLFFLSIWFSRLSITITATTTTFIRHLEPLNFRANKSVLLLLLLPFLLLLLLGNSIVPFFPFLSFPYCFPVTSSFFFSFSFDILCCACFNNICILLTLFPSPFPLFYVNLIFSFSSFAQHRRLRLLLSFLFLPLLDCRFAAKLLLLHNLRIEHCCCCCCSARIVPYSLSQTFQFLPFSTSLFNLQNRFWTRTSKLSKREREKESTVNLVESLCSFSSYYYYHYQMRRFIQRWLLLCCSVVLSTSYTTKPLKLGCLQKKRRIAKSLHSADFVSIISKLLVKKWKWKKSGGKWKWAHLRAPAAAYFLLFLFLFSSLFFCHSRHWIGNCRRRCDADGDNVFVYVFSARVMYANVKPANEPHTLLQLPFNLIYIVFRVESGK
mgnify:CR=1 FL=1